MDVRPIVIGGVVASLVLAMWEMIIEAVIPGGGWILRPPDRHERHAGPGCAGYRQPDSFDAVALVLGLMGHTMNSVVLAAFFGVAVTRPAPSSSTTVGLGMAWGAAVFGAMWFVLLPVIDPLMLNLNGVTATSR